VSTGETNNLTADQLEETDILESQQDEELTLDTFRWSQPAVLLLLDLYCSRKSSFKDPKRKKKKLWQEVVHEMRQKGYEITWAVAEKKMRNIRQTHRAIRDNNSKTGRGRKSWEYFEKMEISGKIPQFQQQTFQKVRLQTISVKPTSRKKMKKYRQISCVTGVRNERGITRNREINMIGWWQQQTVPVK